MSKNRWFVYMHVNKTNGKRYVGIATNPERRWGNDGSGYLQKHKDGTWRHPAFGPAVKKYGWDGFDHLIVLSNVDETEAKYAERYLIKWYQTNDGKHGYNLTGGGDGSYIHGLSYDPEFKKKQAHDRYEKNKDELRKQHREYRRSHKQEAYEYYELNKEEILGKSHEYYNHNKEKLLEQKRDYYQRNKEKIRKRNKAYREQKKLEKLKEDTTNE